MSSHSIGLTRRALLLAGCAAAATQVALSESSVRPPRLVRKFDAQRFVADCRDAAKTGPERAIGHS